MRRLFTIPFGKTPVNAGCCRSYGQHRKSVTGYVKGIIPDFINQQKQSRFQGVEKGKTEMDVILESCDASDALSLMECIDTIVKEFLIFDGSELQGNRGDLLLKTKSMLDFYNYMFGMSYLRIKYALKMQDRELSTLSPGERGTLLLLFYLILDNDDTPLIIDQPEDNLDNQTVFQLLAKCLLRARSRRQVIVVTHNPNLAVACDADQVIVAEKSATVDAPILSYFSGALENEQINSAVITVLEGTRPAFDKRDSKYFAD